MIKEGVGDGGPWIRALDPAKRGIHPDRERCSEKINRLGYRRCREGGTDGSQLLWGAVSAR